MPDGYESQKDYINWVKADADARQENVDQALREAFASFIRRCEVDMVVFSDMTAVDLANAIAAKPLVLKALLASCNVAARAIERDLDIRNLDTYMPNIEKDHALVIAGYLKPFLPPYLELPVLSRIDRICYVDKEIRKGKGGWERKVLASLNQASGKTFRKRRFAVGKEFFELDAATPGMGPITIGIDIKRIEARRDIHKRCDEIVNKATKLKEVFPRAKFGAVIYYPFVSDHANILSRLRSSDIDGVVFASHTEDSIENAVRLLLPTL